jgi:hypothetical protein
MEWRIRSLQSAYKACGEAAAKVDESLLSEYTARAFNAASRRNSALLGIRKVRGIRWQQDMPANTFFLNICESIPKNGSLADSVSDSWHSLLTAVNEAWLSSNFNPNPSVSQPQVAPRAPSPARMEVESMTAEPVSNIALDISNRNEVRIDTAQLHLVETMRTAIHTDTANGVVSYIPSTSKPLPEPLGTVAETVTTSESGSKNPSTSKPSTEPIGIPIESAATHEADPAATFTVSQEVIKLLPPRPNDSVQTEPKTTESRGVKRQGEPLPNKSPLPAFKKALAADFFYGSQSFIRSPRPRLLCSKPSYLDQPSTSTRPPQPPSAPEQPLLQGSHDFSFTASQMESLCHYTPDAVPPHRQSTTAAVAAAVDAFLGQSQNLIPSQQLPEPTVQRRATVPPTHNTHTYNVADWRQKKVSNKAEILRRGREWWNAEAAKTDKILIINKGPSAWACRRCDWYLTNTVTNALKHVFSTHTALSKQHHEAEQRFRDAARGWGAP